MGAPQIYDSHFGAKIQIHTDRVSLSRFPSNSIGLLGNAELKDHYDPSIVERLRIL